MLVVTLPGGARTDDLSVRSDERSGRFDPDIPVEAYVEVDPPASWPADARVSVVLHDEEPAGSFISDDSWSVSTNATSVTLPCPDRRTRR